MANEPEAGNGQAAAPEPSVTTAPGADQNAAPSPNADTSPDQNAASSSSAKGQNDDETLLDAVQRVVEIDEDADAIELEPGDDDEGTSPTPDPNQSKSEADQAKDTDDDPEGELTEAELSQFKPKAQKRIKALLAERDAYRQGAERIQAFDRFMQTNGLSGDDVRLLLEGGALLRRGDYEGFLKHAEPFLQTANQALGRVLPEDVQRMVDDGEVTEAAAQQLALARFQSQRAQAEAQAAAQARDQQTRQQSALAVRDAVLRWEAQVRASDPDYDAKSAAVRDVARGLMAGQGGQLTPERAVEVARQAYERVTGLVRSAKPPARPTRPNPSSDGPGRSAHAEPNNLMEAAMLGLRRAHAG